MSVFQFNDYKQYLQDLVESDKTRGFKAKLADAAGCQRSFFSQVLNGHVHLTLDHALGLARYLRLNKTESDYLYNLVGHARAGTSVLRDFYQGKLKALKRAGENLSKRLIAASDQESIAEYYSSWKYAAIHIALTIDELQESSTIASKLNLAAPEVDFLLRRLEIMQLVKLIDSRWCPTEKYLHLNKDHFMNFVNHRNWRRKALELTQKNPDENISYSGLYSMSSEDFALLKEMVFSFLNESRQLVIDSPEEELVSFNLDCAKFI